jgi:hypothetical protein
VLTIGNLQERLPAGGRQLAQIFPLRLAEAKSAQ